MNSPRFFSSLSVLGGVALIAMACGPGGGGGGTKGEIVLASDLPTSGAEASDGIPSQQGAKFAVDYYLQHHGDNLKNFKLTFRAFDDAVNGVHDPQKGAQNVQQMIADSKILGMVGPFNSNVARAEIPITNQANFVMISPANTNECLTQTFDYCNPKPAALRPTGKNNYFRVAAADTFQGPAMADFAIDTLKVTKFAIWSDNETFGKGVADNFGKEVVKKNAQIVLRQDFDWKTTNDFKPFLTQAKAKGAQAIYAGATSPTKGCIPRAQMAGIFDAFYLGPDGISDTQCIKDAGTMANDKMYSTVAAADATQNPDAKTIVDAYKKAFPKKDDVGAYTFPTYDTMAILIDAVGRAIDANGGNLPSRKQVTDAVATTKAFKATTGTYTFDQNGDPTTPTMAFFQLKGGDWTFVKQFAVGGS
ncbi:MAG TPA: branched-chain amino acid ABC transporter substrate-binding protein [Candidatus Acidoferrales bacterium]|nr:branched-chain amino acid ABC transporter substrate-binding protein [Candidatus Acidoferrales bacterium]